MKDMGMRVLGTVLLLTGTIAGLQEVRAEVIYDSGHVHVMAGLIGDELEYGGNSTCT